MSEQQRGFAGFESLVSDLSDLPAPPPVPKAEPKKGDDDDGPDWVPPPEQKKKWSPKWLVAACLAGGLVVVAMVNSTGRSSHTPSRPSTASATLPATSTAPTSLQNALTPSAAKTEEKPPVGENLVLPTSQLRYCVAQAARIDAAGKVVNATSQTDIDRFNTLVDDYNIRCSKVRYRGNALQTVKSEVETRRDQLEKEGAALIRSPYPR